MCARQGGPMASGWSASGGPWRTSPKRCSEHGTLARGRTRAKACSPMLTVTSVQWRGVTAAAAAARPSGSTGGAGRISSSGCRGVRIDFDELSAKAGLGRAGMAPVIRTPSRRGTEAEQEVRVRNTASRIQEVKGSITTVQSRGRLSYEEAQRLRGRMIFAQLRLWCWKSRKAAIALGDVDPSSTDDGLWQLLQ